MQDPGVTVFESAKGLLNEFVEGVDHINFSPGMVHKMTQEELNCHVLGVIMAQQFNLRAFLKKFLDKSKVAVKKELTQLHGMATYIPMDASKMTKEQKTATMRSLMFLTDKQEGRIKSRGCADRSVKRR